MTTTRESVVGPEHGQDQPDLHGTSPAMPRQLDRTALLDRLVSVASTGLRLAYQPTRSTFPQTMRGLASPSGPTLHAEGASPRYTAIAALGLQTLTVEQQRHVLSGATAVDLAEAMVDRARGSADPGVLALGAWVAAEVLAEYAQPLFDQLRRQLDEGASIPTVDLSWALTAAVAVAHLGPTEQLAARIGALLLAEQTPAGVFPHLVPPSTQHPLRRHIGCFADQVYPIQALARWSQVGGGPAALAAANRAAAVITGQQGPEGQWWWHYDVRDGSVVERFPVYSVHQHAMGPMALRELHQAGGDDHQTSIELGLGWLTRHPEVMQELISDRLSVIWRKVGRREPKKLVRAISAGTTALRPGLHLPGLDRWFPPGVVDNECRPYELGWLLYVWGGERRSILEAT